VHISACHHAGRAMRSVLRFDLACASSTRTTTAAAAEAVVVVVVLAVLVLDLL